MLNMALLLCWPMLQNLPFYRIFVAEHKAKRDGRHLEVVGHYDPHPGRYSGMFIWSTAAACELVGKTCAL